MSRLKIGDKVYYMRIKDDEGEVVDYNDHTAEYLIKQKDGAQLWTAAYAWSKEWDCYHNWKVYVGLNHKDYYCTKCNSVKPWENNS